MGRNNWAKKIKIAVTAPISLKKDIEKMGRDSMQFANLAEYSAFAVGYFVQVFFDDICPQIKDELLERMKTKTLYEKLEFESDYSGELVTWQSSIPLGLSFQLHTIQTIFPQLERPEIIRFSVEYYYKMHDRKEYILTKNLREEFGDINYTRPPIRFKPLEKK